MHIWQVREAKLFRNKKNSQNSIKQLETIRNNGIHLRLRFLHDVCSAFLMLLLSILSYMAEKGVSKRFSTDLMTNVQHSGFIEKKNV